MNRNCNKQPLVWYCFHHRFTADCCKGTWGSGRHNSSYPIICAQEVFLDPNICVVSYNLQHKKTSMHPILFQIMKVFFFCFLRFSLNIAYFSLSLNVGNFGMNVFLTQLIFGLSEIPAHVLCIWLLEVVGRKVSLMSTLLVGGLSCILILAVPQGKAIRIFSFGWC